MTDHFGEKYTPYLWDKRILERRSKKHDLSQSDIQKYLKTLPDEKAHSEDVNVVNFEIRVPKT